MALSTTIGLAVLCKLLSFNGLYGQDAHEYLRQSRVIFDRMHGVNVTAANIGDAQFAGGFPLAAALLRWLVQNDILALQMVSWLSAGMCVWFFNQCLRVLSPGAYAKSRVVFTALTLLIAPYFLRAGLTSMSDMLGLAWVLGAFYYGLRVVYKGRTKDAAWAVLFVGFAITTRYAAVALLWPLVAAMLWTLFRKRNVVGMLTMLAVGALSLLPYFWLKTGVDVALDRHWSVLHFFQRTFETENGAFHYTFPNIVYILFPLAHPGFCLLLPGLLLLAKPTDVILPSKKVVIACLAAYLLLLGGLPHQNMRFLLPAYALVLMLFFPAWDRMFAYGFYFFKRITWSVLSAILIIQIVSIVWIVKPVLERNHLETNIAAAISTVLPPHATVYAFDLDVALRSYLPDIQWKNMWAERFDSFPENSYVLFNEPLLRPQWEGKNPILNWDAMNAQHRLKVEKELLGGWKVFRTMNYEL